MAQTYGIDTPESAVESFSRQLKELQHHLRHDFLLETINGFYERVTYPSSDDPILESDIAVAIKAGEALVASLEAPINPSDIYRLKQLDEAIKTLPGIDDKNQLLSTRKLHARISHLEKTGNAQTNIPENVVVTQKKQNRKGNGEMPEYISPDLDSFAIAPHKGETVRSIVFLAQDIFYKPKLGHKWLIRANKIAIQNPYNMSQNDVINAVVDVLVSAIKEVAQSLEDTHEGIMRGRQRRLHRLSSVSLISRALDAVDGIVPNIMNRSELSEAKKYFQSERFGNLTISLMSGFLKDHGELLRRSRLRDFVRIGEACGNTNVTRTAAAVHIVYGLRKGETKPSKKMAALVLHDEQPLSNKIKKQRVVNTTWVDVISQAQSVARQSLNNPGAPQPPTL